MEKSIDQLAGHDVTEEVEEVEDLEVLGEDSDGVVGGSYANKGPAVPPVNPN